MLYKWNYGDETSNPSTFSRRNSLPPLFKSTAMRPAALGSFSKDQQKLYREWFYLADTGLSLSCHFTTFYVSSQSGVEFENLFSRSEDGDGRITGADATGFFAMSNLCRDQLKKVSYFFLLSIKFQYLVDDLFSCFNRCGPSLIRRGKDSSALRNSPSQCRFFLHHDCRF